MASCWISVDSIPNKPTRNGAAPPADNEQKYAQDYGGLLPNLHAAFDLFGFFSTMIIANHGLKCHFNAEEGQEHEPVKVVNDREGSDSFRACQACHCQVVSCNKYEEPGLCQKAWKPDGKDVHKGFPRPLKRRPSQLRLTVEEVQG